MRLRFRDIAEFVAVYMFIIIMALVILMLFVLIWPAWSADLPNRQLTPGQSDPKLEQKICLKSFRTGSVRDVDNSLKQRVLTAYHIHDCVLTATGKNSAKGVPCGKLYEFDHLISIELGGSNAQANIWPQRLAGPRGARVKDALEDRLHNRVCAGVVPLKQAQQEIATNWIVAYQKYFATAKRKR